MSFFWARIHSWSHVIVSHSVSSVSFDIGEITWETFSEKQLKQITTHLNFLLIFEFNWGSIFMFISLFHIFTPREMKSVRFGWSLGRCIFIHMPGDWSRQSEDQILRNHCPWAAGTASVNTCCVISLDTKTSCLYFFKIFFKALHWYKNLFRDSISLLSHPHFLS